MADLEDVYCTLVLNDGYLPGAAVLAHSLRDAGTTKKLACLIVQQNLRDTTITELRTLYNHVIPVEPIGNPNPTNLYLLNRPDLLYTFTKIHLWAQTQFRKILYIDADVVALRAPEELFDIHEQFAAAPDVGWPDAFNTGVMLISPHMGEYHALRGLARAGDSFDGADQGLLNQYYEHRPWKRISFTYNTTPSANYQYEPAYRYFKRDISLVHFIGAEKPWQRGRYAHGTPNAFQEMLSRWWAVYDRHFHISTADYISGARHAVSHYVHENQHQHHETQEKARESYSATGYPAASTGPAPPPHTLPHHDIVFHQPQRDASDYSAGPGVAHALPAQPERPKFSAPHAEWDATRGAPPVESKPEAANFPTQTYEFNTDPAPFRPPRAYPAPPQDMWYSVPEKPKQEEKPRPIFPWEEREAPRPSRRFVEDEPLAPPLLSSEVEREPYVDELEVTSDTKPEPVTPTIKISSDPFAFTASKNAWDDVTGINNYVRALTSFHKNRGKVQVLEQSEISSSDNGSAAGQQHILSPSNEVEPEDLVEEVEKRRESLLLTHFPTAVERPSLPVTPAPRRRPTFWGDDRDEDGELPPAAGVPDQTEWDPSSQLEQLRRNSLLGPGDLKLPEKMLSKREMPSTAASLPEEPTGHFNDHAVGHPGNKNIVNEAHLSYLSGGSSPHGLSSPGSTVVRESSLVSEAGSRASGNASATGQANAGGGLSISQDSSSTVQHSQSFDVSSSNMHTSEQSEETVINTAYNSAATSIKSSEASSVFGFGGQSAGTVSAAVGVDELDQKRSERDESGEGGWFDSDLTESKRGDKPTDRDFLLR